MSKYDQEVSVAELLHKETLCEVQFIPNNSLESTMLIKWYIFHVTTAALALAYYGHYANDPPPPQPQPTPTPTTTTHPSPLSAICFESIIW